MKKKKKIRVRLRKQRMNSFTNSFFLSKFLIWFTSLPRHRLPQKIAARWRYRLPINNLTADYNSQFCEAFILDLPRKPTNAFRRV